MSEVTLNYGAILVAVIAQMALGFVWYMPKVLGNAWMKSIGLTMEKIKEQKKEGMGLAMVGMVASSFVTAYVLSHVLDFAGATTVAAGMQGAFWCWLGFVATSSSGIVFFEKRSWTWWMIHAGYQLVAMLISGGIIASWQ